MQIGGFNNAMISLGINCKNAVQTHFGSNEQCSEIINDVLSIETPLNVVCNRINFGKDSEGNYVRGVFECKVRKTNTKITIVREDDGKIYFRHIDGSTSEIICNFISINSILEFLDKEIEFIREDVDYIYGKYRN